MRVNVPEADALIDKYFPVLDHGFVALKDYMGGDLAVEKFARNSYVVGEEDRTLDETRTLIRYLMRHLHTSPFESTEICVHLGGPIFMVRQLVRSRTASLNEYSGRYSDMPTIFYDPDNAQVCFQSDSNKQGRSIPVDPDVFEEFTHEYNRANRDRIVEGYRKALERGIARETARINLPLSTYTYMHWKCDLHNLMHFVGLRSDSHAQWEIQQYSDVFAGLMRAVAPICYEAFVDYKYGAVRFSRMEANVLRQLLRDEGRLRLLLVEQGVAGKREQREFIDKLKPQVLKDFALDPGVAKDAGFFMDKVKANL
jgi:thymidylate synthase (FAD)